MVGARLWPLAFLFRTVVCLIGFSELYNSALKSVVARDFIGGISILRLCVSLRPRDFDALQLLGSLLVETQASQEGSAYLAQAVEVNDGDPGVWANYIEALRASGLLQRAIDEGTIALAKHPQSAHVAYNLAYSEETFQQLDMAVMHYQLAVQLKPDFESAYDRCGNLFILREQFKEAGLFLTQAKEKNFPKVAMLHFRLGVALLQQHRFEEAYQSFLWAEERDPNNLDVQCNIGAVHQSVGHVELALERYLRVLPHRPSDAGLLNNLATIYGGLGRPETELEYLQRALEVQPDFYNALVNIAGYHQDDGNYSAFEHYLGRALPLSPYPELVRLRLALFLSPVSLNWHAMLSQRQQFANQVFQICQTADKNVFKPDNRDATFFEVGSSLDRIHFYLAYHGLNDRPLQEAVQCAYCAIISGCSFVAPNLRNDKERESEAELMKRQVVELAKETSNQTQVNLSENSVRRIRIGFLSKFFGLFEPHGLLLDGVMNLLPRSHFHVLVLAVARNDAKPLHHTVRRAAETMDVDGKSTHTTSNVVEVPLHLNLAARTIIALSLDVLVFADTLSEPMAHFLATVRLAPLQLAFWGNPVTSGSPNVDFFLSADSMEHPFRTRIPRVCTEASKPCQDQDPYTEQVVLLSGQGIWYYRPLSLAEDMQLSGYKHAATLAVSSQKPFSLFELGIGSHENFDNKNRPFLFFCPQSVFKMHPLFDDIFRRILKNAPNARLVITAGRRKAWSIAYLNRLQNSLGQELWSRQVVVLERVSSERFNSLLKLADAVLHPFPFDGSKTSVDVLAQGKPLVSLPTEYLRGRMGSAFLRTLNLPELVAHNTSEYVKIAVRLASDALFYRKVTMKIAERSSLIWEDYEFPYEVTKVLCRLVWDMEQHLPKQVPCHTLSLRAFLELNAGKINVSYELERVAKRAYNRQSFINAWGDERELLIAGKVFLPSGLEVDGRSIPRVFADWGILSPNCTQDIERSFEENTQLNGHQFLPPPPYNEMEVQDNNSIEGKLEECVADAGVVLELPGLAWGPRTALNSTKVEIRRSGSMEAKAVRAPKWLAMADVKQTLSASAAGMRDVVLLQQYFHVPGQQNFNTALVRNLANPYVSHIIIFCEREIQTAALGPISFSGGTEKLHTVVGNRLTFSRALEIASTLFPNHTNSGFSFDNRKSRIR